MRYRETKDHVHGDRVDVWSTQSLLTPQSVEAKLSPGSYGARLTPMGSQSLYTVIPSLNSLSAFLIRTATGLDAAMQIVLGSRILFYQEMKFLCQEQVCNAASSFLLFSGNGKLGLV